MVFEARDLWPELPISVGALKNPIFCLLSKYFERWAYAHSSRIIALSPGTCNGMVRTGFPSEKVFVIPNSCDIDVFIVPEIKSQEFLNAHPELKGRDLVVYTGTFGLINGMGYLVEVAHSMLQLDPTISFLIVGDGKEHDQIKENATNLGVLNKNLWMMSSLPKREMACFLLAATVSTSLFINLPEMWNNPANKFFDALAGGWLVMINYKGWQADLIRENGACIIVPAKDASASDKMLY
jgi:glycosyltransferase involved in cell wall biosynthesis